MDKISCRGLEPWLSKSRNLTRKKRRQQSLEIVMAAQRYQLHYGLNKPEAVTFGIGAELQGCALAQSAVTFEGGGSVTLAERDASFLRRAADLNEDRALLRGPN
jgi:hypothetical protein